MKVIAVCGDLDPGGLHPARGGFSHHENTPREGLLAASHGASPSLWRGLQLCLQIAHFCCLCRDFGSAGAGVSRRRVPSEHSACSLLGGHERGETRGENRVMLRELKAVPRERCCVKADREERYIYAL